MTALYSNNFESYAHVATVPDFTALGTSANFIVLDEATFNPPFAPQGAKSYAANGSADNNYWNGGSAIGDQGIRTSSYLVTGHCIGHTLRTDIATADRHYWCYYGHDGTNLRASIWIRNDVDGGITSSSYSVPAVAGDTVWMESLAVGTSIEVRLWVNGGSRPSSATVSITDSTFSTGRHGFRKIGATTGPYANVDEVTFSDGADFGGGGGPFLLGQPCL